jgi:hypothetical protein
MQDIPALVCLMDTFAAQDEEMVFFSDITTGPARALLIM